MQIEEFLQDFGNPFFRLIKEKGRGDISFKWSKQYSLPVVMSTNETLPLFAGFTPNGNFGGYFVDGANSGGVLKTTNKPFGPRFNALFVDLDLVHTTVTNSKELFKLAIATFTELGLEPTYVVDKDGGPHIYWIIDPDQRQLIDDSFSEEEFCRIIKYISSLFIGGDQSIAQLRRLMRLPNTLHWKKENELSGKNPRPCMVYQRYDGELHLERNALRMNYIGFNELLALSKMSAEIDVIEAADKKMKQRLTKDILIQINSLTFGELFLALKKYPRTLKAYSFGKKKEDFLPYDGMQYYFELEGNEIGLRIVNNGELIKTSGYKLKEEYVSYVNNFTSDNGIEVYTSFDRPKGTVYSFLFHYFGEDRLRALQFLQKEFSIEFSSVSADDLFEGEKILTQGEHKLMFLKTGIKLETLKVTAGGGTALQTKTLFDIKLDPIGYAETTMGDDFTESADTNRIYIFHDPKGNRDIVLRRYNTKSNFNKYLNKLGIHFFGDDDSIGTLFSILDSNYLPKLDPVLLNGVYKDFVMLGGKIIHTEEGFTADNYFFNNQFCYRVATDRIQISPAEFIDKMKGCFDEKFLYISVLQFSAMMLMNTRDKIIDHPLSPSLMFTGTTGKGKTTIVNILKSYGGYYHKEREFSLGGKATSPQPIKQAATDNSILFLEEVTGIINPAVEQAVRGIINRDRGGVGLTGGKNLFYLFRSPVLALGQRTFIEDSINNRFAILDMDHQMKRGNSNELAELSTYSCTDYIYKSLFGNEQRLVEMYNKYSQKLVDSDLEHRARDVMIFVFIMNEFLDINLDVDTLVSYIKRHLRNVGLEKPKVELSREGIFKGILIEGFMKRCITGTYSDLDNNRKVRYEIYIDSTYLEQNRSKIFSSIAFFNDKSAEDGGEDVMHMIGNMLTISIKQVQAKRVDTVLDAIMGRVVKTSKGVLHYVPAM